ncbi:MAG: protein jag [Clostridia bacterium]|nr:protein jag [Clostridia bacterium]
MQKVVKMEGRTVQEAIDLALKELDVNKDEVDIEILEHPSKGLFGLIGGKPALVEVKTKETKGKIAKEFLQLLLDKMGIQAEVDVKEQQNTIYMDIKGKDMGIVIGYRGQTLDSLQYIVSLYVNKDAKTYRRIILDTENYRSKREKSLKRLAMKMAEKVKRTGKNIMLEPMNPYERRILHATLQNNPYVRTHSEGQEPYRKVMITLK